MNVSGTPGTAMDGSFGPRRRADGVSGSAAFALTYFLGQRGLPDDPFGLQSSLQRAIGDAQ